ncbi:hypothetical protein BWQ96_03525 [Gracilariopsis chorda]|uniref:Rab3-GAP regulatory subunit N-terminal domain-containing protein n=1 Tax=Gracilariopsis chorda TaxID=448386 RepID=A0A2V3IX69_9FLOR|nr:hypothetical protein BWQ96_03525 [Gracilariopsis chorda]|eukprot:PXF46699.1 hypothetical protein BWQ96_03525 [Gracilariopsis chorda]
MSFRLRHRAHFEPLSLTRTLQLRPPRLHTPRQWHWAWPLQPLDAAAPPPPSPLRAVWASAVRAVAVADDASALAFVSHDGRAALLRPGSAPRPLAVVAQSAPLCTNATSLAFFHIAVTDRHPPRHLLAVSYHSGAVAFFDVNSATLLAVSRPQHQPVRRLRYYPTFHLIPHNPLYPVASTNSGLIALYAWTGAVARISATDILNLLAPEQPVFDPHGTNWLVWNLTAQHAVLDVAPCATDPSSICEPDPTPPHAPLRLAAAGLNPPLAAYSVTTDAAFSARTAAKRAASTMLSAARGFFLSRIGSASLTTDAPSAQELSPVIGVARHSASWADDFSALHTSISIGDMRDTARKSVNAVLQRGSLVAEDVDLRTDAPLSAASALYRAFDFRKVLLEGEKASASQPQPQALPNDDESVFVRKRSLEAEVAARVARLPQNARIIERVVAAPLPCSLLATSDTLGRIFVQDPRDLCVLRVLKGYRDAQMAWLAQGGPLLVVYAPRLSVLELHQPLAQRRIDAFRLQSGTMLVQSSSHHVFVVFPDGNLYELKKSRKGHVLADRSDKNRKLEASKLVLREEKEQEKEQDSTEYTSIDENYSPSVNQQAPDVELVDNFTKAVRKGYTSMASECLQRVEKDAYKLAYLMATLVTCTSYIRTEVHVALASKAAEIASRLENSDLVSRFEAHRKLAEAFGLLAADEIPFELTGDQARLTKYGHRLLEDDLGAGLAEFAVDELKASSQQAKKMGKRSRRAMPETELINCERFILSHAIAPTLDVRANSDYQLQPRSDLEAEERVWLSKAYFLKLLELESVSVPTPGREHPIATDVFIALKEYIAFSEAEITRYFVTFFLNVPILSLLNTHVSLYASPLRCAVSRLCSQFPRDIVDPIITDACETTSAVPNAVLLIRLCAIHDSQVAGTEENNRFLESLGRLDEVLLFRKLVRGSSVSPEVSEKFVARRCTGVPGDAERHALTCLIDADDFNRASNIIVSLHGSRTKKNFDRQQSASISEAALHACRRKAAEFITREASKVLPAGVLTWILASQGSDEQSTRSEEELYASKDRRMREMRALLLNAHTYIVDSSVDAVRCLQLAEALSALLEQEALIHTEKQIPPAPASDIGSIKVETVDLGDLHTPSTSPVAEEKHSTASQEMEGGSAGKDDASRTETTNANPAEVAGGAESEEEEYFDASSESIQPGNGT